jgi:hypothetical protein
MMTPYLSGNTLYFSSSKKHNPGITYENNSATELYDIYTATRVDSISFSTVSYSKKWSSISNDGSLQFDKEEKMALMTSNVRSNKHIYKTPHKEEKLKLFYAVKKGKKWSELQMLPFCKDSFSYCHGTFSGNNLTIIFSSDMSGGYGGMDLYLTYFDGKEWSSPKNLGRSVNSEYNEIFPFVNAEGELFFSSDRKGGFGGLDIYQSINVFSTPDLLEAPINSENDDFGIWTDSTGNNGYLTSNRLSKKTDALFYFYKIFPHFEKEIVAKTSFCYTFFEEASTLAGDTAGLQYEWVFDGKKKYKGREVSHCFDKPGVYPVLLNVVDKSSGELLYNEVSYDFAVEAPKQLNIACTDTISEGNYLCLDASASSLQGYTIKKYFWTLDDGWYAIGPQLRHKYLNKGFYRIKLGVLAVNDTTGKEATFYSVKKIKVQPKNKTTGSIHPKRFFDLHYDLNDKERRKKNKLYVVV